MRIYQVLLLALCLASLLLCASSKKGKHHHHHKHKKTSPPSSSSSASEFSLSESNVHTASAQKAKAFFHKLQEMHKGNPTVDVYKLEGNTKMGKEAEEFINYIKGHPYAAAV